jgi:hypothetical protein
MNPFSDCSGRSGFFLTDLILTKDMPAGIETVAAGI